MKEISLGTKLGCLKLVIEELEGTVFLLLAVLTLGGNNLGVGLQHRIQNGKLRKNTDHFKILIRIKQKHSS